MRRRFELGLIVGAILLGLAAGCHNVHHSSPFASLRPSSPGVMGRDVGAGGSEVADESPIPEEERREVRRQHTPNRLSGAWSSEAAEIEQSLGVSR
jgi:hypothetical protein